MIRTALRRLARLWRPTPKKTKLDLPYREYEFVERDVDRLVYREIE